MENWEETLDVDDDLHSFAALRPCKHQRRTSQTLDSSQLQSNTLDSSQSPSQTLDSSSRTIPGPAAIFQVRDNPMPYYIRKVVEEDDFKRSPWLSAIEYVNADNGTNTFFFFIFIFLLLFICFQIQIFLCFCFLLFELRFVRFSLDCFFGRYKQVSEKWKT